MIQNLHCACLITFKNKLYALYNMLLNFIFVFFLQFVCMLIIIIYYIMFYIYVKYETLLTDGRSKHYYKSCEHWNAVADSVTELEFNLISV